MNILVTGAAGFIGSNTCVALLEAGYNVIGIDNLSNSYISVLDQIEQITNRRIHFYEIDLRNKNRMNEVFQDHKIDAVIHFAALKSVGESVEKPLHYYDNNVNATLALLEVMDVHNVKQIVFSSSATVYAPTLDGVVDEKSKLMPINPYGQTKLIIEQILNDLIKSDRTWSAVILRYFNPVGAHQTGRLGENPIGEPKNLAPYILKVGTGQFPFVKIFGSDYKTKDGTGARDYIHVSDVASAHLSALAYMKANLGLETFNIGVGRSITVMEMIKGFEQAMNRTIPYQYFERRAGDQDISQADNTKALNQLDWQPKYDLIDMCSDAWKAMSNAIND